MNPIIGVRTRWAIAWSVDVAFMAVVEVRHTLGHFEQVAVDAFIVIHVDEILLE